MSLRIAPLADTDAPQALKLLEISYDTERKVSPLLPAPILGDNSRALPLIRQCIRNFCVAAFCDGCLVGFLGVFLEFQFKGQRAALMREFTHAATGSDRTLVYQSLYAALGEYLRHKQTQLHIVAHFAGDSALRDTLYQLGFGAFLAGALRDLSAVDRAPNLEIGQEHDFLSIAELDADHNKYYRAAPIFLKKDDSPATVRSRLLAHQENGDTLFVYRENGCPKAYFIVGPCVGTKEGLLLQDSNAAQILSAYAEPGTRGNGVGKALLDACVRWASRQSYRCLFVEHETANILGSLFWHRHFDPYLCFSMRYVEDCV